LTHGGVSFPSLRALKSLSDEINEGEREEGKQRRSVKVRKYENID
jgi:hypothetical protein